MPSMLLQTSLSNSRSQQLCSSAWPFNSYLKSAISSLLLPTVVLQNKSRVKQQHGFQFYYPEVISNCSHLLQKHLLLLTPANSQSIKLSSPLLMPHITICVLCGPNWLILHPQILMVFSKIHINVQMTVA